MSDKNKNPEACRLGKVGGQAVLEGVMMRCGDNVSLSVRCEDGSVKTETKKYVSLRKKYKLCNIPIIRGVINMVESFKLSFSTLEKSAEMLGIDETEEEGKFEKWLRAKLGDSLMSVIMGIAMVLGVVLALFLFKFLPTLAASSLDKLVPLGWFRNLIEGVIKIGIFVAYIALCSLMPEIRRTFEYHGAEHKSIACYEAGLELTPENASTRTRLHPRCGTSFIFVALILSIIVFSFLPWANFWLRLGLQLLFLPLVIGLSFEFIIYAGRHQNVLTKVLSTPGLLMQRITTREPSLKQLEVAIASIKAAMPDEFPPEAEESTSVGETDGDAADDADGDAVSGGESGTDACGNTDCGNTACDNTADGISTDSTDADSSDSGEDDR